MKYIFSVFLLFTVIFCRAQFSDAFDDGDFFQNQDWNGDTNSWEVLNNELHSINQTINQQFYIQTISNSLQNTQWELDIKLEFNTSSTNYVDIYLAASQADLTSYQKGYFVRIGGTQDEISLYRKDSFNIVKIIDGKDARTNNSSNHIKLKIWTNSEHYWALFSDTTFTGNQFSKEGTTKDSTYLSSGYFGFLVKQSTASFFGKHFFDNVIISAYLPDTLPPLLTSFEVLNSSQMDLKFNEEIAFNISSKNFKINSSVCDSFKKGKTPSELSLFFNQFFQSGNIYHLLIDSLPDEAQNIQAKIDTQFFYFLPSHPEFGQIIITEIMADPDPALSLPNAEYIEIYNTSNVPLQLQNINFTSALLPKFVIEPNSYVVITSISNISDFPDSIQKIGLSSFPSLLNTGQNIYLVSQDSEIIHQVNYSNDWHSNGITKNGGWSLEMKDLSAYCQGQNNWETTKNLVGGTPGFTNSVITKIPAENSPQLSRVYPKSSNELWLYSDKIIPPNSFKNVDFFVTKSIGNPIQISYLDNTQKNLKLNFPNPFLRNETYSLEVSKIHGCLDSNTSLQKMDFGMLRSADSNDITLNEILFNPFSNGADFVEIYNKTGDFIDLQNLWIANTNLNGKVNDFSPIASNGFMLSPHEYIAITENPDIIKSHYPNAIIKNLWKINSLPSYNDDEGTCILTTQNLKEFDRFSYSKKDHHPSIDNDEGISLEKINPFESNTSNFWTSASTLVNATPGYKNSQFMKLNLPKGSFSLSSPSVSPDGDGYEDIVYVQYKMPANGYTGTIEIFDIHGIRKRTLINNELLATEGNILFDGTDNYGIKLPPGIYPIYFSSYNSEGNIEKIKSSIVVAVKF